MKVGVIGNTLLTFKAIKLLVERGYEIQYVFGLPDDKLKNKVNSYNLRDFCLEKNIPFYNNNNWNLIADKKVNFVCEMGDSRIIPATFLQKNFVIGNHGAILPSVQGAASLVWGKMLNSGHWGVSLMKVDVGVDSGSILKTKEVIYDKEATTMEEFVGLCDDATIDCLKDFLNGKYTETKNEKWRLRISKKSDSKSVSDVLVFCLQNNINVYLPPRRPEDARIRPLWDKMFVDNFKKANDFPYPKYYSEGA